MRSGLRALTRSEWRLLWIASLPWLLYNAAFQIMMSFLPSFFVDGGSAISDAGSQVALSAVVFVVGVQVGGFLLRDSRRADLVCHLALGVWCVTLLLLAARWTPWPWIVLGGLLGGMPAAVLVSLPGEFLRPQSRSVGLGVFYTIYYFGCALLPTLAGGLYDLGGGRAALWMAAALTISCAAFLALSRRAIAKTDR